MFQIDFVPADRPERAAIERIGEQRRAVGGKTDGGAAGRAAAARVGQVGWHAGNNIALFAAKIALQFDDGRAPRNVDASAVVDEIALVFQFAERGAKAFPQQLGHKSAQRLVSRPRGHRPNDVREAVPAPEVCHLSPPA